MFCLVCYPAIPLFRRRPLLLRGACYRHDRFLAAWVDLCSDADAMLFVVILTAVVRTACGLEPICKALARSFVALVVKLLMRGKVFKYNVVAVGGSALVVVLASNGPRQHHLPLVSHPLYRVVTNVLHLVCNKVGFADKA
jgi:hypothetical protein